MNWCMYVTHFRPFQSHMSSLFFGPSIFRPLTILGSSLPGVRGKCRTLDRETHRFNVPRTHGSVTQFSVEGIEIVMACISDPTKAPVALLNSISILNTGTTGALFIRPAAGGSPVVPYADWYVTYFFCSQQGRDSCLCGTNLY